MVYLSYRCPALFLAKCCLGEVIAHGHNLSLINDFDREYLNWVPLLTRPLLKRLVDLGRFTFIKFPDTSSKITEDGLWYLIEEVITGHYDQWASTKLFAHLLRAPMSDPNAQIFQDWMATVPTPATRPSTIALLKQLLADASRPQLCDLGSWPESPLRGYYLSLIPYIGNYGFRQDFLVAMASRITKEEGTRLVEELERLGACGFPTEHDLACFNSPHNTHPTLTKDQLISWIKSPDIRFRQGAIRYMGSLHKR